VDAPLAEEGVPVINLMNALRRSLGKAGKPAVAKKAKLTKKIAGSRRQAAPRKRKSS
jgi:non-homologous end joining protein Ku